MAQIEGQENRELTNHIHWHKLNATILIGGGSHITDLIFTFGTHTLP